MHKQRYLAIEAPPPRTPPTTPEKTSSVAEASSVEADIPELMRLYKTSFDHLMSKSQNNSQLGVGFQNMGNTCFMNTTLQAIINTPKIREYFTRDAFMKYVNESNKLGTKGIISSVFSALVDLYFSGDVTILLPEVFLETFAAKVNKSFADGRQHDAQEFQTYLMDALHEDTNRVKNKKPFEQDYDGSDMEKHAKDYNAKLSQFASSPIADLFNLRTVSVVTCNECGTSSATFEDQAQISLELEDSHYNSNNNVLRLDDCLKKHFKEESLQDDSQWNCPTCKEPRDATRETKIWKMPKTLIIHFKRFSESEYGGGYVKNRTNVQFEIENLKMDQHLHEEAPQQDSCYSLYAITNHFGTLNSGHYTSYVKSKNGWLNFDDEYVSEVSHEALQSKEALVLFYTARKK